jgi:hypothetical protein
VSDIGFHMLSNAWLLMLVAPLVLFYFLKLKRPHLAVPSLVLWRQVIMDRRVNSPFQRFKRNLLLLLQLLILLLIIAAALQPFWRRREAQTGRTVVMVDCSASMAARDGETGTPRLELARRNVEEMIEGLVPGDEIALIAFSNTARRVCDFTDNKRLLGEALAGIAVEEVPSDAEDAVRMAQSLTQGVAVDEVVLFSDGNVPARVRCDLSFDLNYQVLPPAGPNIGITSLNAVRRPEGGWDAFALVEGSAGAAGPFVLRVLQDGEELAVRHSSLAEGGEERIGFSVGGERRAGIQVAITPESADSLASDNAAWLDLPATRRLRV